MAPAEDEIVEIIFEVTTSDETDDRKIEPAASSSTIGDEEIDDIVNDVITAAEID